MIQNERLTANSVSYWEGVPSIRWVRVLR